jgi:hypothetical protein
MLPARRIRAASLWVLLSTASTSFAQSVGPDVVVGNIASPVYRFGKVADITGYASSSVACNFGNQEVLWVGSTSQHPVLAQQLYRLKDGRFEQVGLSWAKHEFLSLAEDYCAFGCIPPNPYDGTKLGAGCSHPATYDLNGKQTRLGPRGQINAFTGVFPYYFTDVPYPPPGQVEIAIGRRLQVHDADLDPALNAGASYYLELQYIARDDASVGNGFENNVSYRPVTVSNPSAGVYNLTLTGTTQRYTPAIHAWATSDPTGVVETVIDVPLEGRFILAAKAADLGGGTWHYEYALYNLNSDRSARSFLVPTAAGTAVTNIGFHDVDYHDSDSDGYAPGAIRGTDWPGTRGSDAVSWQTDAWDPADRAANAVRWGTVYNFRFDADQPPVSGYVLVGLYKPGSPADVCGTTILPQQLLGACCLLDATCLADTALVICDALAGTWFGGSACDRSPCDPPASGACCDSATGACTIQTEPACVTAGLVFWGGGTVCDPNPCPQPPTGACCNQEQGTCTILTQAACQAASGLYRGDSTSCDPNPCLGACCLANETCIPSTTTPYCEGLSGYWRGPATDCPPGPCFDPTIPAVSDWGSALLFLLMVSAGILVFRNRARPATSRQQP